MCRSASECTSDGQAASRSGVAGERCRIGLLLVAVLLVCVQAFAPRFLAFPAGATAEETPQAAGEAAGPSAEEAAPPPARSDEVAPTAGGKAGEEAADTASPWAFSLTLYAWLPGVDAELSSGSYDASLEASLLDIFDATEGIPLTVGGRLEGWWKRLGLYVDGNYFYLNFEDQEIQGVETGVLTEIGLLKYAAMFRLTGAPAGEDVAGWTERTGPPRFDLYAGGRTTWLKNEIDPEGLPGASTESTLTSPLVGARITVDLAPRWFFYLDGNVGGFTVDDVQFAGEGRATFGYRTTLFGAPIALSLGYTVLYLNVDAEKGRKRIASDILLHGPVLDLTFSW